MRLRAPSRGLALSAALLLTLTACGGGPPEEDGTASPTTTAPASATDGTGSEGAGSDGSDESEGTDESEGSGESDPDESSDAESTEADSGDGDSDGSDGEYVPASAEGPAQNVPKPVMPEEMKEETHEGAKAAVQYWWDTAYYLRLTGDAEPMGVVSHESCGFCKSYANALVTTYEDGGWMTGAKVTVTSALTGAVNSEMKILEVTTLLDSEAGKTYPKSGKEIKEDISPERTDEPWLTDVRYDEEFGHWRTTWVSYEGEDAE